MRNEPFVTFLDRQVALSTIDLGGVLSKLRKASASSSEYLNEFVATGSSSRDSTNPANIFNPDNSDSWYTNFGSTTQWIQIEMKNKFITMTGYTLRTFSTGSAHPKSWKLEGKAKSSDPWTLIDERSNVQETNKYGVNVPFVNNVLSSCTFKIFKLTTSEVWGGQTYLGLEEMDFNGISSNNKPTLDYLTRRYNLGTSPKLLSLLIIQITI